MQRHVIGALLAGVLIAGCGGVEVDEDAALETRRDELPACLGQDYTITYYTDASHSTWRGTLTCGCGYDQSILYGFRSSHFEKVYQCN
ncbi:hypothetical protein A176_003429 [Myxococcus hansupus]|uniref:Lipoprotein n=1 Tax=Pseudomyxococcus hansupus TaxID=1297742 RepID=A0A0H4XEI9_9BACT|nr:hypothetical protein [Myxococcus hansupus]AKQ66517.1 hypothetical protein A176_003429 [Myxococcus hansupus]